jgi:hypothetical protein
METRTSTNNVKAATQHTPVSENGYETKMASTADATNTEPAMNLDTEFLRQVRARFLTDEDRSLWPAPPDTTITKEHVAAFELPDAVSAMFDRLEREVPFPSGMPGTAINRIKAAALAAKWPTVDAEVPAKWLGDKTLFHEFEIGAVVNIMMRAFNRSGKGGTPRDWPPTNP